MCDVFSLPAFISTSKDEGEAKKCAGPTGTVFCINSLSGRDITVFSVYNTEKEVLMAPFTSFITEKIETTADCEMVWLTEVESPSSLNKNVVLWVDDIP